MQRIARSAAVASLVVVLAAWTLYAVAMALPIALIIHAIAGRGIAAAGLALGLASLFYAGSAVTAVAMFTTVRRHRRGARWTALAGGALAPLAAALLGAIGLELAYAGAGAPFFIPTFADFAWHHGRPPH